MGIVQMVVGSLALGIIGTAWLVPALLIAIMFVMDPPWSADAPIVSSLLLGAFVVVPPLVCILSVRWYVRRGAETGIPK